MTKNNCLCKSTGLIYFAVNQPHSFHFYPPASLVQNQLIDIAERNKSKDLHNLNARELMQDYMYAICAAYTRRSISILYWLGCDTLRHCVRSNYLDGIWLTLHIDCT